MQVNHMWCVLCGLVFEKWRADLCFGGCYFILRDDWEGNDFSSLASEVRADREL